MNGVRTPVAVAPAPVVVPQTAIRPGRWLYLLAALLLVGGVVGFGVQVRQTAQFWSSATRLAAPGTADFYTRAGQYMIAYEYRSVLDGKAVTGPSVMPALTLTLTSAETGQPVRLQGSTFGFSYDIGARAAESFTTFTVSEPGRYRLAAEYEQPGDPPIVLAVVKSPGRHTAIMVGIFVLALPAAFTCWLVTFVRRRSARHRLGIGR